MGQGVDPGDLVAGIGHHRDTFLGADCDVGQCGDLFDLGGVHDDLSTREQPVEDCLRPLPGTHPETELGIVRVREPAHRVQIDKNVSGVTTGKIEYATPAHRGQLMPITDQRQASPGDIGDLHERHRAVLIQHARLVDHQQIASA